MTEKKCNKPLEEKMACFAKQGRPSDEQMRSVCWLEKVGLSMKVERVERSVKSWLTAVAHQKTVQEG